MKKGTCPMCLNSDTDICNSHFMPAALYPLMRADEYEPVRVSAESIYPTSKQMKHPLFCDSCEQLLNREGENWIMPLLPTVGGPFPLRERLMSQSPISQTRTWSLYAAAKNPEIDVPKLTHFGVGIFYKAAVHSWVHGGTKPRIDIGDDDTEALRLNLLGQRDRPKHIALCITVDSAVVVWQSFVEPYRAENREHVARYVFYVPGVFVQLFVGKDAQETVNCINANPLRPVLCENVSIPMRNTARGVVANARKTKKLEARNKEIEKRGLSVRLGD
jgi:hypothetical protein